MKKIVIFLMACFALSACQPVEVVEVEEEVVELEEIVEADEFIEVFSPIESIEKSEMSRSYDSDLYAMEGLFDACGKIENYVDADFYDAIVAKVGIEERGVFIGHGWYSITHLDEEHDYPIDELCYSKSMQRVVMLARGDFGLGGSSFIIVDYDIEMDEVVITSNMGGIEAPGEFGERKGSIINLQDVFPDACIVGDLDLADFCKEAHSVTTYTYDLETMEITSTGKVIEYPL